MHKIVGIVAMTPDRIIGSGGTLPWHLPADLAFFKRTTTGHPIVMGRKTYESIGRPLPNRRNIVLTRSSGWTTPGVEVIHAPSELADLPGLDGTVFIIGGAEIYQAFLPETEELLVTHVLHPYPGDTVFPEFQGNFILSESLESNGEFTIRRWVRKR